MTVAVCAWSASWAQTALDADLVAQVRAYDYGASRAPLEAVRAAIRASAGNAAARAAIESALLSVASDSSAKFAGRQFACRELQSIGGPKTVEVLAPLLTDPEMSDSARGAIEMNPAPSAAAALRAAMDRADGKLRIGIINSLGNRAEASAVDALVPLTGAPDRPVADAACTALGKIGGEAACAALSHVASPDRAVAIDAWLRCAAGLTGDGAAAGKVYEAISSDPDYPPAARRAALSGWLRVSPAAAGARLSEWLQGDASLQMIAAGALRSLSPNADVSPFASMLPRLSPPAQVAVIATLADRADARALPALTTAATTGEMDVRLAAIQALGAIPGDAARVRMLAGLAAASTGDVQKSARSALASLRGADVDAAVVAGARTDPDPAVRKELIDVVPERRPPGSSSVLLGLAADPEGTIRLAALRALERLGDAAAVDGLIACMAEAKEGAVRDGAQRALLASLGSVEPPEKAVETLKAAFDSGTPAVKAAVLSGLAALGGPAALSLVSATADGPDETLATEAVRCLARWRDSSACGRLTKLAESGRTPIQKALAYRGALGMLDLCAEMAGPARVKALQRFAALATSTEEKQLLLTKIATTPDPVAAELARSLGTDAAVKSESDLAVASVERLLALPLGVSASHNPGAAGLAVDGKADTRWDSGMPMQPGMWFLIDRRQSGPIKHLVLDAKGSPGDVPRGCTVHVGDDPSAFDSATATGKGKDGAVDVRLKNAKGRFIRITLTAPGDGTFWSIHEIRIE